MQAATSSASLPKQSFLGERSQAQRLHVVSYGTSQAHFTAAVANVLTGRCLSLDMRR